MSTSRPRPARPSQRAPATGPPSPGQQPAGSTAATGGEPAPRAAAIAAQWAPLAGRILLGLVLGWFGYHELAQPSQWTGYVPALPPGSPAAVLAVLAHGWLLLILAAALITGIATRIAAAIAAATLAEIVLSLTVTAGLSDLVLRDLGVLGLAICLTGITQQHLVLRR